MGYEWDSSPLHTPIGNPHTIPPCNNFCRPFKFLATLLEKIGFQLHTYPSLWGEIGFLLERETKKTTGRVAGRQEGLQLNRASSDSPFSINTNP